VLQVIIQVSYQISSEQTSWEYQAMQRKYIYTVYICEWDPFTAQALERLKMTCASLQSKMDSMGQSLPSLPLTPITWAL